MKAIWKCFEFIALVAMKCFHANVILGNYFGITTIKPRKNHTVYDISTFVEHQKLHNHFFFLVFLLVYVHIWSRNEFGIEP